ncbi:MAG: DNA glycosylase AlkZ-like family protein, partial [Acidimicrobiia bacterium]
TLLRSTIHLVSAGDYWPLVTAISGHRRKWFMRVYRGPATEADFEAAATEVARLLAAGPQPRGVLENAVGRDLWTGVGAFVDLVRVPPSGTWERRRADLFGLAQGWIAREPISVQAATEWLIRRYLGGFGPAQPDDIAVWAGLPADALDLEPMKLRRFATTDGRMLLDVERAPIPAPDVPVPVRFIPVWDAMLLVHARLKGIIAEEYRPVIFNSKNPQSLPTFLVDGTVAGTWRYEGGKVKVKPFAPIPRKWKRELGQEAAALAAFHS